VRNFFKCLPFGLPIVLVVLLTLVLLTPHPVQAAGTATVDARPTAHTITGVTVANPAYAYDNNLGTYAQFDYDDVVGSFAVTTFTTPSSNLIHTVDIKMHYEADSGGSGENYRIVFYVGGSSATILQDWTNAAYGPATRTWASQTEPNDGAWSWTDISNLRIVVETGTGGGGADRIYEHEAWVTVTTITYTPGTIFVNPASLSDPASPFTVDIDISSADDLYGWEFKLYYNTIILGNGSVTEGSFLAGSSTFFSVIDNTDTYNATHGRFWVTCTKVGNVAGASGSGTLATISFTVDGPGGTTPLDLQDTKLIGYIQSAQALFQMGHTTTDGQVTISGAPEFPLGAALEIALIGVIFYIWRRKRKPSPEVFDRIRAPLQ
jgi:hypothetical protein